LLHNLYQLKKCSHHYCPLATSHTQPRTSNSLPHSLLLPRPPCPLPLPPQTMSASEVSDDHFNEYAPGHMPMPDFEALARDIQKRASCRVDASPARRPRHHGGRDGGAGAMCPSPDEVCAGGSDTHCVRPGGRHRHMPVHDGALGNREGGEGATATGGGGGLQGGRRMGTSWWGHHRRQGWVLLDVLVLRQIP
jgi:hypothetical protein